ncbi:MAG: hypothetical protein ACJ8FY_04010 [Gemmataceae bacterium]
MTTSTKPYDRFFEKAHQAVLFGDPVSEEVAQHLLDLIEERDEQIATHEEAQSRSVEIEYKAKQLLEHLQIHLRDLHDQRANSDAATRTEDWFKGPIKDLQDALES